MAKSREPFNPFYALVLVLGAAFCLTTFAFYTMAYRASGPIGADAASEPALMRLLDRYGTETMLVELGLLGVASFGAMWLDGMRSRGNKSKSRGESSD